MDMTIKWDDDKIKIDYIFTENEDGAGILVSNAFLFFDDIWLELPYEWIEEKEEEIIEALWEGGA
jgi:hypothetical protein